MTDKTLRINDEIRSELVRIADENGGYLKVEAVVEAASSPDSPLHHRFEWDDTAAARKYRNVQAGVLIRQIKITVVRRVEKTKELKITTTREFQSLLSARGEDGGGYESVIEIMSDADKRVEMLATVLAELTAYRQKYAELTELSKVWKELDRLL